MSPTVSQAIAKLLVMTASFALGVAIAGAAIVLGVVLLYQFFVPLPGEGEWPELREDDENN